MESRALLDKKVLLTMRCGTAICKLSVDTLIDCQESIWGLRGPPEMIRVDWAEFRRQLGKPIADDIL